MWVPPWGAAGPTKANARGAVAPTQLGQPDGEIKVVGVQLKDPGGR
jgi:hypothetical protein